jgi:hypothetical protein
VSQKEVRTNLLAVVPHEDHEILFIEYLDGNPPRKGDTPGQIKAFKRRKANEKRVPLHELPTPELQKKFIALTGKEPEELGLVMAPA